LLVGGLAVGYSRAHFASAVEACSTKGANTNVVDVQDAQRAVDTIANSPFTGRAKAMKIIGAAQKLKGEYNAVVSQASGAEQLKQIAELYKNRTFWIELMDRLHATLPQPSPEVAAATTSAEYVAALKKIPRTQRRAVYIDQLEAGYVPDTTAAFAAGTTSGSTDMRMGGGEMDTSHTPGGGGGPAAAGPKGFVVILKGRTPYGTDLGQAVVFLSDWASKLKDIRGQSVPFYVDKLDAHPQVLPVSAPGTTNSPIQANLWAPADAVTGSASRTNLLAPMAPTPGPAMGPSMGPSGNVGEQDRSHHMGAPGETDPMRGGGAGGLGGPVYGAGTAAPANLVMDPLTGEPTASDYAFQVKFTVVLGQAPERPAEATTASH
jgi:hypothetical protein